MEVESPNLSLSATCEASCIYSLLLIITLRFTCDAMNLCSAIKNSQNIMNMIVGEEKSLIMAMQNWSFYLNNSFWNNWFEMLEVDCFYGE